MIAKLLGTYFLLNYMLFVGMCTLVQVPTEAEVLGSVELQLQASVN